MPSSSIAQWNAEGIAFQKVSVTGDADFELRKVFYDEVVLLAFTGAVWTSEQAGKSYVETPDCVVMRDAGQVFSARLAQLDDPVRGLTCRELHIPPARLRELEARSEGELPHLELATPVLHDPELARQLFRVHTLFEEPSCALEASTALAQLLIYFGERSRGDAPSSVTTPACSRRCDRVVAYLRANFDQKISLDDLASLTESNPYVLLRQFRRAMGATPHEYLRAYRVYRAKEYIQQGVPLAQVAMMCGFSDQSHFNRQFKQSLSITPTMYRRIAGPDLRRTRVNFLQAERRVDG